MLQDFQSLSDHRTLGIEMLTFFKCVLKNFAKFTGKHLRQSLFFDKVAGLRFATLLNRRL